MHGVEFQLISLVKNRKQIELFGCYESLEVIGKDNLSVKLLLHCASVQYKWNFEWYIDNQQLCYLFGNFVARWFCWKLAIPKDQKWCLNLFIGMVVLFGQLPCWANLEYCHDSYLLKFLKSLDPNRPALSIMQDNETFMGHSSESKCYLLFATPKAWCINNSSWWNRWCATCAGSEYRGGSLKLCHRHKHSFKFLRKQVSSNWKKERSKALQRYPYWQNSQKHSTSHHMFGCWDEKSCHHTP